MEQNELAGAKSKHRVRTLALCIICIFLGSSAENTMSNWISVYTEKALGISKIWGDIFGMALFATVLGLTRTAYSKVGKNITRVLTLSMAGATACYLIVAFSNNALLSMIACVAVGVCTSMLWPGTLILMEEKLPSVGVAAYALMAAGGDLGASFAPQALGAVVDKISASNWADTLSTTLSLTPEQIGFRLGMLLAAAFPFLGFLLITYMKRYFKKHTTIDKTDNVVI